MFSTVLQELYKVCKKDFILVFYSHAHTKNYHDLIFKNNIRFDIVAIVKINVNIIQYIEG